MKLDERIVPKTEELVITTGAGYRIASWGAQGVCDDGPGCYATAAEFAVACGPLTGKSVAWIGGGFCVGPSVFAIADCQQTVYEIEPSLAAFCPAGMAFVPGDYRTTLIGKFDIIIYDLGGEVPRDFLTQFLNPSGRILPLA